MLNSCVRRLLLSRVQVLQIFPLSHEIALMQVGYLPHWCCITKVQGKRHDDSEQAVAAALSTLEQLRAARLAGDAPQQRSLVLVEVHCEHRSSGGGSGSDGYRGSADKAQEDPEDSYEDRSENEDRDSQAGDRYRDTRDAGPRLLTGLARVDDQVRRLYEAAAPGTLLLVVTQGSMVAMKLLASQKMR